MYDATLLLEKLEQIDEALARIERRFASINSPNDFLDSDKGLDMLDGIAMMGFWLLISILSYGKM